MTLYKTTVTVPGHPPGDLMGTSRWELDIKKAHVKREFPKAKFSKAVKIELEVG